MKTFSFVYMIAVPYLLLGAVVGIVRISGDNVGKGTLIAALAAVVLLCMIAVAACIMHNTAAIFSLDPETAALQNLIIKLSYLPAHLLMALITLGMMNPFLLLASWIPLFLSWCMIAYSGFGNIGACVNLLRRGKCSVKMSVLLCVLSFCFFGDIIGAAVQTVKSK